MPSMVVVAAVSCIQPTAPATNQPMWRSTATASNLLMYHPIHSRGCMRTHEMRLRPSQRAVRRTKIAAICKHVKKRDLRLLCAFSVASACSCSVLNAQSSRDTCGDGRKPSTFAATTPVSHQGLMRKRHTAMLGIRTTSHFPLGGTAR